MRLYTPAKPSTSLGEDVAPRTDAPPREDRTFNFDSRSADLADRSIENEPRLDERLQINAPRIDDKPQLNLARLDDKLHLNGPLREEQLPGSPTRSRFIGVEVNGVSQNGPQTLNHDSVPHENGSDTLRSLDSVPWNLDGTQTIIENGSRAGVKNGSALAEENGQESHISLEEELKQHREENKRLKAALSEAAEVNNQWRQYHDERQSYVQRLLTTIHELQHSQPTAHSPRQLDGEGSGSSGHDAEVRRLRESMARMQADHEEHVQLLEMQVRAHRDDWEAERSEKRAAQTSLAEAEARTALLLQELQLLQAKLADTESKRGLCWRCLLPRTDFSNRSSRCSSTSTSAQASPVPAPNPPGAPSAPPVSAAPIEPPPAPLKGWIPVSMLHQIAFSGATPEHQTPVVHAQPRAQPSSRPQTQGHPASSSKSTPGGQATLGKAADKTPAVQKQEPPAPQPGSLKLEESRGASTTGNAPSAESKTGGVGVVADEKKKYEAMGARPKVLGNLQPLAGKGVGLIEDEKSAKHRARSILASAIPVSPVSSGPPTPCGPSLTRSPSTPNMPKGYMPITSTILTPINFRQPFVAHKRPSTMKQITQAVQAASQASSSARARSETSPSGTGVRPDSSSAQSPPVSGLSSALAQPHGEALLPAHARSDSSPAAIGLSFPAGGGGASQAPGAKLDGEAPSVSGKGEGGVSPPASTNAQSGVEEVPSGSSKVENSGGKEAAAPAKGGVNTAAAADNAPKKTQSAASSAATESSNSAANNHASKPSSSSSPPKTVVTSDNTKVTTTGNTTSAPSSAAKTASSSATAASSTNTKSVASSTKAAASNNTKVTTSSNSTVTTSSNTTGVASKNTTVASSNSTTTSTSVTTTTARNSTASTSSKVTTAAPSRTTAVTNSQNTSATTSRSTPGTSTAVAAVPNKTTTVNSSKAGASTKNTATKTAASSNPSSAADNTTVIAKASAGTVNKAAATSAGAANPPSAGPAAAPNASAANGLPKTGAASASSTAFASITVTTTAAGTAGAHPTSSASTYSSATSSRSSSPGVSLTTFGLNSEGRGIPGAIFFALRPEQNGIRSPQPCPSSRGTSASSVKSPTPDSVSAGQSYRQTLPPSGVKSPPILEHPASNVVKEEHWWSVESPGRSSTPGRQQGGKLVNSTWVRLMGGQANNRQSSGLPWRTARAVSGQQLDQARRASHEDSTSGPTSPNSMSSTATFNYTPAVNSPPSSNLSSATNSAATSPLPAVNQRPCEDLRSMASKNISSAIMSYELGNKCEPLGSPVGVGAPGWPGQGPDAAKAAPANDGVATMTRRDLVCPSCQMLFPPEKHLQFLDHFEVCRGPEYADL